MRRRRAPAGESRGSAKRAPLLLLAVASLAGCTLAEVVTAPSEDVLVVESVLRAGAPRQVLLLHHAVDGVLVRGEGGATITVRTAEGREVPFGEANLAQCADRLSPGATDSLTVQASCYVTEPDALPVQPGGVYELRVATRDGRRLRGRTTVPGAWSLRAPREEMLRDGQCLLRPGINLPLVWTASAGAWSYLSTVEVNGLRGALAGTGIDARDRVELTGLSISERDTTLLLPAQFGLFEAADLDPALLVFLQKGFPAGVALRLTIAAVDRNYVNAVRGGNFNPSGNVRISSVTGDGVGVFASVVPKQLTILVRERGPVGFPLCLAS